MEFLIYGESNPPKFAVIPDSIEEAVVMREAVDAILPNKKKVVRNLGRTLLRAEAVLRDIDVNDEPKYDGVVVPPDQTKELAYRVHRAAARSRSEHITSNDELLQELAESFQAFLEENKDQPLFHNH